MEIDMADIRPNLLLITTDQQRYDTCGEAAPAFMRTPHFDQLAREGVTFTAAYADCPLCVPSRVSIMTGMSALGHNMLYNGHSSEVMGHEETLPALLRHSGYQTAAIGKMHFTPQRLRHGFEEMILPDDYYHAMHRSGNPLQPLRHGLGQNEVYAGLSTVPEPLTLTSWITEQCVEYLQRRRDPSLPFMLWCSFSKPHPPFDPPEPYYSMYRDCPIDDPITDTWRDGEECPAVLRREQLLWNADRLSPDTIRAARVAYYGLITQIDYNMGRLFAALQETGLYDNTMILYTSDHGEMLGDHRSVAKTYFYEPASHVPFLLRLPRTWEHRCPGMTESGLVSLCDIMPTFLAAAGVAQPSSCDGRNLIAQVREELPPRSHLEATVHDRGVWGWGYFYMAITDGRWKYIWYPEGPCEQLFDLQIDPHETQNLASSQPYRQKRDELKQQLTCSHRQRELDTIRDGKLIERAVIQMSEEQIRNHYRLACYTELAPFDIRH